MPFYTSHRLGFPYLQAAQAQKHVTLNQSLQMLDILIQTSVLDRTRTTPPPSPSPGDAHIIADDAQDEWEDRDGQIAVWQDNAWHYHVPNTGWRAWCETEATLLVRLDTGWAALTASSPVPLPSYTATALPDASGAGRIIYVPDASGGPVVAFCDGSDWKRISDNSVVN